jgi:hypothetical protein
MRLNNKMTRGKIDHILSWASAIKAKYVWTDADAKLEEFLKSYRKEIVKELNNRDYFKDLNI